MTYESILSAPIINDIPFYHVIVESCLLVCVLWLIFHKSYNPSDLKNLSEKEKEQLIKEWVPEPLVKPIDPNHPSLHPKILNSKATKYILIGSNKCLNLATHNYLGFIGNEEIEKETTKSLYKYGVGSAGPRGFYGTMDVHLDLEERLAKFMDCEEAVVYSYGFSTMASAIPAYCKRHDIIFVDEKVNFPIQKGLDASRSKIIFFKHNDTKDLERLLKIQQEVDLKNPKKALKARKFLIVEGIYINTGKICPLPDLIDLRKKYKLRIFIDESISFGTLGNGRGVTEHFNIKKDEVDMIMASMENSMATIGGFCVGSSFVVDHQRLSGLGYCFSASLPPLLATAAIASLDLMEVDPTMFINLKTKCKKMHETLEKLETTTKIFHLVGDAESPVKHLYLINHQYEYLLPKIVDYCIDHGLFVIFVTYLKDQEKFPPHPSLRITVNKDLNDEEFLFTYEILKAAIHKYFLDI